jgi:AAA domain
MKSEAETHKLTEAQLTIGPSLTDAQFRAWLTKPKYKPSDFDFLLLPKERAARRKRDRNFWEFNCPEKLIDCSREELARAMSQAGIDTVAGKVINDELPQKIHDWLDHPGSRYNGKDYGGDRSRQDSAGITAMLRLICADDTYATFTASARGTDAMARHQRNYHDYLSRTIQNAQKFLGLEANGEAQESERRDSIDPADWRKEFKSRNELDDGPIDHVIEQLIPEEGITGLGALPGTLKTFIMMSWAKAISSGALLWGRFKTRKLPILYLIPESGDKNFRRRMVNMHIPNTENFLVRTMSMGKMLSLEDERVHAAVKRRVVFLDTLVRFTEGKDEQYARDMAALGDIVLQLLAAGAVAIVVAHHSRKESRNEEEMTLENCFRGSGDIGAIMSAAYGVRMLEKNTAKVQLECVKARDFEPILPMQLQARPWIDRNGDLRMTKAPGEAKEIKKEKQKSQNNEVANEIKALIAKTASGMSANRIAIEIGGHRQDVYDVLKVGVEKKWWVNKGTDKSTSYIPAVPVPVPVPQK